MHPTSWTDADRIFAALAGGGTVTMRLADQFRGDHHGGLTDRIGINWMVNYHDAPAQSWRASDEQADP